MIPHTKGPWTFQHHTETDDTCREEYYLISAENDVPIVRTFAWGTSGSQRELDRTNVSRIVGSVNFCAGVPTAYLQGNSLGLMMAQLRDPERAAVCLDACDGIPTQALQQDVVNDLLKICRQLTDLAATNPDHRAADAVINRAKAVIARAEGG